MVLCWVTYAQVEIEFFARIVLLRGFASPTGGAVLAAGASHYSIKSEAAFQEFATAAVCQQLVARLAGRAVLQR